MSRRPAVVLLDVNETLSDLSPLDAVFADLGAPPVLAQGWLTAVLRDGIALACAGVQAPFADVGADVARRLLAPYVAPPALDAAAGRVLAAFTGLGVHEDVPPGLRALADLGIRLATLSNGAASVAEGLLERAGVDVGPQGVVERCLSVADAGVWKPGARAYTWACAELGVAPEAVMLVAVHPWDCDGALRAGTSAAWIDRTGSGLGPPAHFLAPTMQAESLVALAGRLGDGSQGPD